MNFPIICWSCKGTRHVQIESPVKLKGLVEGDAIKQGCWLCRGTGYLNAARVKEYESRQRRLHAMDAVIVAKLAERWDALQDK